MAVEGGASWLTIHARTRIQGYRPPVFWKPIGEVQRAVGVPVIANGDLWSVDDFHRCQDETGAIHFMLGRPALADPGLAPRIAAELGLALSVVPVLPWSTLFRSLVDRMGGENRVGHGKSLARLKQWMNLAHQFGEFPHFAELKLVMNLDELFERLDRLERQAA
jgi:tRNA-dihydrouridine synthase C